MSWVDEALGQVEANRRPDGARTCAADFSTGDPATEPTALAAMALTAHGRDATAPLDWLLANQRPDGGFAVSPAHDESTWVTAVAAIALLGAGRRDAGEAAVNWLLNVPIYTLPVTPNSPYGYDTSLPAWPWTPGDFSWVEPTALAMLAIQRSSHANDPRVAQGLRLLADRAAFDGNDGGWNYGEPRVLGADLSPAVVPTALVILAARETEIDLTPGIAFLERRRDSMTSLFSLAWAANAVAALYGLNSAWRDALARTWVATASSPTKEAGKGVLSTALALLAVAEPANNPLIRR
ncbi:MAG TPA: hypothetical protein PLC79_03200 [Phycisphaerae bacterium]|nr:hypothetical protein [Phycisphaerae bacterium]